jgi:predicted PurR-regulated permease PerM
VNNKWIRDDVKRIAIFITVLICVIILFSQMVDKLYLVGQAFKAFFKAISAIVAGCVIAFLLCPIMNFFKPHLTKFFRRLLGSKHERRAEGIGNALAVVCSVLVFLIVIVGLLWILIPELQSSIARLYSNIPTYINTLQGMIDKLPVNNDELQALADKYLTNFETTLTTLIQDKLMPNLNTVIATISSGVIGGFKFIVNLFVGVIVAIYILATKDQLAAQGKKIIYCLFSKKVGNTVLDALDSVNNIFGGFINGKIVDSAIIGVICAVFCISVDMPYAVLISVVIGITNIIPFFGPFIGAIPSALLVLVESPSMSVMFVIFIILLQQVDGNVIGPLILGDSTGLSGLWIMFAILAGGNLFGLAGMVLGVPVFACIYTLFSVLIGRRLEKRGLTTETDYYITLRRFDEQTGEPIRGPRPKRTRVKHQQSRSSLHQAVHSFLVRVEHKNDTEKGAENSAAEGEPEKQKESES